MKIMPRKLDGLLSLGKDTYVGGESIRFKIVLHRSEEGYSVSVPGLSVCWSQGRTEEEALANIQDAIREYLAAVDEIVRDREVHCPHCYPCS